MNIHNGIIEAPVKIDKIRKTYNWISRIYFIATPFEKKARMRGTELAQIEPDDKVLEVAVGLGHSFLEILRRIDRDNTAYGVDLSPAMLEKTRKLVMKNGYTNFRLTEGDARHLPFSDETFDTIYNSYMLDLIPLTDIPVVLKEFYRVLKKDGRLVLVNLSQGSKSSLFWGKIFQALYKLNPYLWGGCRPVFMQLPVEQAGFRNVKREIPRNFVPSEIVTGLKLL